MLSKHSMMMMMLLIVVSSCCNIELPIIVKHMFCKIQISNKELDVKSK